MWANKGNIIVAIKLLPRLLNVHWNALRLSQYIELNAAIVMDQ